MSNPGYGYPQQGQPFPTPQYPQQPPPAYPPQQYAPAPQYPQQQQPAYAPPPQAPAYGPPQQYGHPQGPPPPPAVGGTIDDFLGQPSTGGGPSLKWNDKPAGYTVAGYVARDVRNSDVRQQTAQRTNEPLFHRDGRPKLVMIVPLLVQPTTEHPDGKVGWWVKGEARDLLAEAMKRAGSSATVPEGGARVTITKVGERPIPNMTPATQLAITYELPAGVQPSQAPAGPASAAEPAQAPQQPAPAGQQWQQPPAEQGWAPNDPRWNPGDPAPAQPAQQAQQAPEQPVYQPPAAQPQYQPQAPQQPAPAPQAPAQAPAAAGPQPTPEQAQLMAQLAAGGVAPQG